MGWGVVTLMLARTRVFHHMVVLRVLNGLALGTLSPLVQSLIADLVVPEERGFYFGCMGFCRTGIGMMATALIVTSISNQEFGGIPGWQVAFLVVGCASVFIGVLISVFFKEPPPRAKNSERGVLTEIWKLWGYFRTVPTFTVLALQGMFGTLPFSALTFLIMFFQYIGIQDHVVARILALQLFGAGLGYALGGVIGDKLEKLWPNHGRVLTAQLSVLLGMPIVVLLFSVVSKDASNVVLFTTLCFILGVVCSWCDAGCNRPIFLDIVPATSRASAFSWLQCIEWSFSQLLGLSAIGLMSEYCFGYEPRSEQVHDMPLDVRRSNADALGKSLLLTTMAPWLVSFFFYCVVHVTYKRDRGVQADSESTPLC